MVIIITALELPRHVTWLRISSHAISCSTAIPDLLSWK